MKTKSKDWEYEKEIRIIKISTFFENDRYFQFNKDSLVEIIFGSRVEEIEESHIINLAIQMGYNKIKFKKARLLQKEYGLSLTDL